MAEFSPSEQAERDHLAHLCDVAACLATIAWPEPVGVIPKAPRAIRNQLTMLARLRARENQQDSAA